MVPRIPKSGTLSTMKVTYFTLIVCSIVLVVQGCSSTRFPTKDNLPLVHKIDIQQGNVITQEMLAQLELGMEKKKVLYIMGSPIITDTFHNDRWDYVYSYKKGRGVAEQRHVTLFFKDDLLKRVEGDVKPARGKIHVESRKLENVEVPPYEGPGLFSRVKDAVTFGGDKPDQIEKSAKEDANATTLEKTEESIKSGDPDSTSTKKAGQATAIESSDTAPTSDTAEEDDGFFGKLWDKQDEEESSPTGTREPDFRDPTDPDMNSDF